MRWLVAIFIVVFALPLGAQETAAKKAFQSSPLDTFGPDAFERIVSMERVPKTERFVTEVLVKIGTQYARLPIVMARSPKGWSVTWTPIAEYCDALKNLVTSKALSTAEGPAWSSLRRIPAFPIIVTNKRLLTPFGIVTQTGAESLQLNEELARHTGRWIREVYGNDPAPAAFDIIASQDVTWLHLNEVVFSVSSEGLYQVNLVTQSSAEDRALSVARVSAPVSTLISVEKPAYATVALYVVQGQFGVRVVVGSQILPGDASCHPQMTFCADSLEEVVKKAAAKIPAVKSSGFVLLATSNRQTVAEIAAVAEPLAEILGLAPHHLLVAYIEGAP